MTKAVCAGCGRTVHERSDTPVEDRASCPVCGSTARKFAVDLGAKVTFHDQVKLKKFDGEAKGRAVEEIVSGADFNRDSGKWYDLKRHIDRVKDRYTERIVDPSTGDVVREVDEPLSKHRGRGDARRIRRGHP